MADYKELWTSLDIDLEKHDQLCAVLPEFYGEIYMQQENRPEAMNYYNFVVSEIHGYRVQELADMRKDGRKVVGTFCVYVPDEIIVAANAASVGLCAGSEFWHPDGEKVVPRNTCPLVKAAAGALVGNTCPYFKSCDMLVGETTCDAKKKLWETFAEYTPIHVMNLSSMKREQDYINWQGEIKLFKERMEELTGVEVTAEKLSESTKLLNDKRIALQRLYETRKVANPPISGKDALLVTQIAFYDDPARFTQMTNQLCDELEQRIENGEGVFDKKAPRILITGTPMAIPNWKLHHVIETSGGAVVAEETCTGVKYFQNLVDESAATLEDHYNILADRYLKTNCACFTPNTSRIDDIIRLYKDYAADGVVYYTLPFCTTYAAEFKAVKDALAKENIPVINIESDYGLEDAGQIKTRLEAFFEMISNK